MVLVCSMLALLSTAGAAPLPEKTSQDAWPERRVDERLVLPRGRAVATVGADAKISHAYRGSWGERIPYDGTWTYARMQAGFALGFSSKVTLYLQVPWVHARLTNARGADVRTTAMGDVHSGIIVQPWRVGAVDVGLRVDLKAPSGVEWPGDFIGGPANVSSFLTGTGITNIGAHALARLHLGQVAAVDLSAGYVLKPPAVVGYVVESGGFGNGWLNPGDEIRIQADGVFQLTDALSVGAGAVVSHRTFYFYGTSGEGTSKLALYYLEGPDGTFVDVTGRLDWRASDRVDLAATVAYSALGTDTRTFAHLGLEEFSPQPGTTLGLQAGARW